MHTLESNFFAMTKVFVDHKCKELRIKCNSSGIRSKHYYKNVYLDWVVSSNKLFSMRKQSMETRKEYLAKKRKEVLSTIEPMLKAFGIEDFDYVITNKNQEVLVIQGQKIGCTFNSISAIVNEVIGYLFVNIWARNNGSMPFKAQTLNFVKHYWIKED